MILDVGVIISLLGGQPRLCGPRVDPLELSQLQLVWGRYKTSTNKTIISNMIEHRKYKNKK